MAYKAIILKASSKEDFKNGIFQESDGKTYGIRESFNKLKKFGGKIVVNHGKKFIGEFLISHDDKSNREVKERFAKWL